MNKIKNLILNNVNITCFFLSMVIALIYCFYNHEFCKKYSVSFSLITDFNGPVELQLYYTTESVGYFNEQNSKVFLINNLKNVQYDGIYDIYTSLNENIILWRFDLGNKAGNIKISKFTINGKLININSIDFNNLLFSPDLALSDFKDDEFSFVSKGNDPYFFINEKISAKPTYSIKNVDVVIILYVLMFFMFRDLFFQFKKLLITVTYCK